MRTNVSSGENKTFNSSIHHFQHSRTFIMKTGMFWFRCFMFMRLQNWMKWIFSCICFLHCKCVNAQYFTGIWGIFDDYVCFCNKFADFISIVIHFFARSASHISIDYLFPISYQVTHFLKTLMIFFNISFVCANCGSSLLCDFLEKKR